MVMIRLRGLINDAVEALLGKYILTFFFKCLNVNVSFKLVDLLDLKLLN
jgi:hypothetical protein